MATVQGICKNCGSLMMFEDKEKDCECVFCNCIFPSAEAIALLDNPDGAVFPNEKFEKSTDSKHYYSTKVYSDEGLTKAIANDEVSRSRQNDSKIKPSDFEVSPNDVKAPVSLLMGLIAALAVVVILVIVTAYPAYTKRNALADDISAEMACVLDGVDGDYFVKTDAGEELYKLDGQNCQSMTLVVYGNINSDEALTIYNNYVALLNSKADKTVKDIEVTVYCDGGIYNVTGDNADAVVYTAD